MLGLSLNFCLCNLHIKRSYFGTLFFLPERPLIGCKDSLLIKMCLFFVVDTLRVLSTQNEFMPNPLSRLSSSCRVFFYLPVDVSVVRNSVKFFWRLLKTCTIHLIYIRYPDLTRTNKATRSSLWTTPCFSRRRFQQASQRLRLANFSIVRKIPDYQILAHIWDCYKFSYKAIHANSLFLRPYAV